MKQRPTSGAARISNAVLDGSALVKVAIRRRVAPKRGDVVRYAYGRSAKGLLQQGPFLLSQK